MPWRNVSEKKLYIFIVVGLNTRELYGNRIGGYCVYKRLEYSRVYYPSRLNVPRNVDFFERANRVRTTRR